MAADASDHLGLMTESGGWTLMAHGVLNLGYDHQSGPRGGDKVFACGNVDGHGPAAARQRARCSCGPSLSPDPLMGPRGYPLLLASGETANGVTG